MNRRFTACAAALLLTGLGVCGFAVEFPLTVAGIRVDGSIEIRDRDILQVVGFGKGDQVLEADLKTASQAIFDLGWFSEVVPEVDDAGSITFHLVENPVVREIVITGNVNRRSFELLGIELFDYPLVSSSKIRRILRTHDIREGAVLNVAGLETGLQEVISEYKDQGYVLVMIGEVTVGETLEIEIIEARIGDNVIVGLETVPTSIAEDVIDIPIGEPLQQKALQRVLLSLRGSICFSNVEVLPQPGSDPDVVILLWNLEERKLIDEPVNVEEVTVAGITQFPVEQTNGILSAMPEGPLDNYGLLTVLEDLYSLYVQAGYIMVRFMAEGIDGDVLRLSVDEGEVATITVAGNTKTESDVILRHLGLRTGRVLTRNDLRVAHQQLSALGYFGSIDIVPEWTDEGVEISVTVTEKDKLGGINGAIALDPNTGGLVGEITIHQRNLLGTGQDLSVGLKRGLTDTGEPSESTWNLGYSTVAIFSGFKRVGFDVYQRVTEYQIATEEGAEEDESVSLVTLGGQASASYPLADYTDLSLSYRYEEERLRGRSTWTEVNSVSLALVFDDTDDPAFPTRGARRVLTLEKAGGFAVGPEFMKAGMTWTHFTPGDFSLLSRFSQVFAVRLKGGWGDENLSWSQAYDLGGATTVRGTGATKARRLFVANFEYRVGLAEGLVTTAFVDAGLDLDNVRLSDALTSAGIEFGITAAGMFVRLDLSWVMGEDLSWMPRFDFGFSPMF